MCVGTDRNALKRAVTECLKQEVVQLRDRKGREMIRIQYRKLSEIEK